MAGVVFECDADEPLANGISLFANNLQNRCGKVNMSTCKPTPKQVASIW